MKAQDFISLLRKVIREEVRSAIRVELNEKFGNNKKPLLQQKKTTSLMEVTSVAKPQPPPQPLIRREARPPVNTGNPLLNQLLAETVVERDFGGETSPYVGGGGDYSPEPQYSPEMLTESGTIPQPMNEEAIMDDSSALPSTPVGQNFPFMKDYSEVLKKAEQISNNRNFG